VYEEENECRKLSIIWLDGIESFLIDEHPLYPIEDANESRLGLIIIIIPYES